eukprot:TRINITY_DN1305_c0_g3_i2.p1 TRINITY_DN1305_c0_g3~~TRINITY_DN1305_c0_g3_i2.p1  ORF type:complete len:1807 (-),score=275.30 TRINITY_DN1305_c0_g3_i2:62-5482(-)
MSLMTRLLLFPFVCALTHVVLITAQAWIQRDEVSASNKARDDSFGVSVALTNNYALIGAHNADPGNISGAGAAYVFIRTGTTWIQQATLTASNKDRDANFGYSVASTDNFALIGSYRSDYDFLANVGSAYIFRRSGAQWTEHSILMSATKASDDSFGRSVALTDNYALIGADGVDLASAYGVGAAYVYALTGDSWIQQAVLMASNSAELDYFGSSVALTDEFAIVGADGKDLGSIVNAGAAYVYIRKGTKWIEQTILSAREKVANDAFGRSVALSENYALIGLGFVSKAYVFSRDGETWLESEKLNVASGQRCVAINRNYALVRNSIYSREGSAWSLIDSLSVPSTSSVALSEVYLMVGNTQGSPMGVRGAGEAYIFQVSVRAELMRLFQETGGDLWFNNNGWNTSKPICAWYGLTCESTCLESQVEDDNCPVISLGLSENNLVGTIPTFQIMELKTLVLSRNRLSGTIPKFSMSSLKTSRLDNNQLTGLIPNFEEFTSLKSIDLRNNQLSGFVPKLPTTLQLLDVSGNIDLPSSRDHLMLFYLTTNGRDWKTQTGWSSESDPCSWYGVKCRQDCPKIQNQLEYCPILQLSLANNNLSGMIDSNLWSYGLQDLKILDLSENSMKGTLPTFNMPNLETLNMSENKLQGTIPDYDMFSLIQLILSQNGLSGTIPNFNMPRLSKMQLQGNMLTGPIPNFNMRELSILELQDNQLSGTLPNFKLRTLTILDVHKNLLAGTIPNLVTPELVYLDLSNNQITGSMPSWNALAKLAALDLSHNRLIGTISNIQDLINLRMLNVTQNQISGSIPSFDKLASLAILDLSNNKLQGTLPRLLLQDLTVLHIGNNYLTGSIPDLTLPRLLKFSLCTNKLSGTIPSLIMPFLIEMDLSDNLLSGTIPDFTMPRMKALYLRKNRLTGSIPDFTITQLEYMDISRNSLTGSLPTLKMPHLVQLRLHENNITGTIPGFESNYLREVYLQTNNIYGHIPILPKSVTDFDVSNNTNIVYPRNVLYEMYHMTGGNQWTNQTNWTTDEDVCSWFGVTCNQDCPSVQSKLSLCPITRIDLNNNGLLGSLSSGTWLDSLPDLLELNLASNHLTGTIPNLSMPKIVNIYLNGNKLTGIIPSLSLPKLEYLYLSSNKLTGFEMDIDLPSLTLLDLSENRLSGSLPDINHLDSLVRLDISSNMLTSFSQIRLQNLQTFLAFNNSLSGYMPELFLPQLTYLDLSYNQLNEPLPPWMNILNLEYFIVYSNYNLTGPLPNGMDGYSKISGIDIRGTKMRRNGSRLYPMTIIPSGQYQLLNPSDNYQCPIMANPRLSRSSINIHAEYYDYINCRCQPGTFGMRNKCITCPSGCICETGMEIDGCYTLPSLENVSHIIPCPNPIACKTSISGDIILDVSLSQEYPNSCLDAYEGRVCAKCKQGYGAQGRSCIECDSTSVKVSFVLGPIVIIALIIYLYRSDSQASGKLGILIFHVQTLSVIANAMTNSASVESSMELPFSISSIQIPSVSCVFETTNAITPLMSSFIRLPIIFLLGFLGYKTTQGHTQDKVIFIVLHLVRSMYYPIAVETFGVFSCTIYDEAHDKWYLNAWPWISCDPKTSEYNDMLAISVPTFLVFVCGFPLLLWYIILRATQNSGISEIELVRNSKRVRYGFLYLPYNKEYRYWGIVTTLRLLCFGLVTRIVPYTSSAVIFILLLVLMQGSIWLQYTRNPYLSKEENTMELVSLYMIFFSYFLMLISNVIGQSSWIVGIVIGFNAVVILLFLWKNFGQAFVNFFNAKQKVAHIVGTTGVSRQVQEQPASSVTIQMKSIPPNDD